MPTYSFTRTREQLRDRVLRKLGVLEAGESPSADDAAIVDESIDLRLKEFHRIGTLWYQVAGGATDVALVGGTATANAPADCLFPVSASLRVGAEDRPIAVIGHRQYQDIPNKLNTGEPEAVFFSGGVFRFWPVPQANYTAKITYQAIAADSAANAAPDVDIAMMRAFACVVAADLVEDFGTPEPRASRILGQVDASMRTIAALNVERVAPSPVEADYF